MDRNDRLVIIAGIIVLIVALIGIVYHEKTYVSTPEVKQNSYRIEWTEYSDEITTDGHVDLNGWSNNYTIDAGENAVISSVEFMLQWTDDFNFHGIIFPWNWTDKIEMTASIKEFSFSDSRSGYEKITIDAQGTTPQPKIVKADNETAALKSVYKGHEKIDCKVNLKITPKPRFFDKGNDFTLHIVYHYYKPEVRKINQS